MLLDGTLYLQELWTSNVEIQVDIDGLIVGTYNFTIIIYDSSGNSVSDEVTVIVFNSTTNTSDPPQTTSSAPGETSSSTVTSSLTDPSSSSDQTEEDGSFPIALPNLLLWITSLIVISILRKKRY